MSCERRLRQIGAGLLILAPFAVACATTPTAASGAQGRIDPTMSCSSVGEPMSPILRSGGELRAWFRNAREQASHGNGANGLPPRANCERAQLGEIDWNRQSVAFVRQSGASRVESMSVRGDALVVRRKGIAQCGGTEEPFWSGVLLVVVPAKVVEIEAKYKPGPACEGPPRP